MKNLLITKLIVSIILLLLLSGIFIKSVVIENIVLDKNGVNISNNLSLNGNSFKNHTVIDGFIELNSNIDEIEINMLSGDIDIEYHNKNSIKIEVDNTHSTNTGYYLKDDELIISSYVDVINLDILGKIKKDNNIKIYIPENYVIDYEINTAGSIITSNVLIDNIEINTANGDIVLNGEAKDLSINCISSEISIVVGNSNEDIEINTVNGDIVLHNLSSQTISNIKYNSLSGKQNSTSLTAPNPNFITSNSPIHNKPLDIEISAVNSSLHINNYNN